MHSRDQGQAQELRHFHRPLDHPIERLATGVLEYKHLLFFVFGQSKGPDRPRGIKFTAERILMLQLLKALARRARRARCQQENRPCFRVSCATPVKGEFLVTIAEGLERKL